MKYLLDSVIVIDHFNGITAATDFLSEQGNDCALSVISRAETLAGFDEQAHSVALDLLNLFSAFSITPDIADQAARLRRIQRWKLPDAIQAAVAIEHGLTLVTRNTKDFQPDNEVLPVRVPYRI